MGAPLSSTYEIQKLRRRVFLLTNPDKQVQICAISTEMPLNRMNPEQRRWFDAIRASLTRDLLSKEWRERLPPDAHPVAGHCYKATEAAYYAFGRQAGFEPHVFSFGNGVTHWWLAIPGTDDVIDLTHEQTPAGFEYASGDGKFMRLGKGPGGISETGGILLQRARARIERG